METKEFSGGRRIGDRVSLAGPRVTSALAPVAPTLPGTDDTVPPSYAAQLFAALRLVRPVSSTHPVRRVAGTVDLNGARA